VTLRVRIGTIFFNEVAIGTCEQAPVEIAQVVAGIVLAILRELSREARGERCSPDMKPSTTARASSSSEPMRASSSGSKNLAGVVTDDMIRF
jgi:hypothetical protein